MSLKIISLGVINTDIIAFGLDNLPGGGEASYGGALKIGPGGKSRNMACMMGKLLGGKVAMIGKTNRDKYGLWKIPMDALKEANVNIDHIKILDDENKFPSIALISVDKKGENAISVCGNVGNSFSTEDIDDSQDLFKEVSENNGLLVMSLEMPYLTADYAIKKANSFGLKVMVDPGGLKLNQDYSDLFTNDIYLIKPNEQESKLLTGIDVVDFESAKKAADVLITKGVENVFITVGAEGGYLFSEGLEVHIPAPESSCDIKDSTGCGDQTMATLCAFISEGESIEKAAEKAILAGTLQFGKSGISPLEREDVL